MTRCQCCDKRATNGGFCDAHGRAFEIANPDWKSLTLYDAHLRRSKFADGLGVVRRDKTSPCPIHVKKTGIVAEPSNPKPLPVVKICIICGTGGKIRQNLCQRHYFRWRRLGKPEVKWFVSVDPVRPAMPTTCQCGNSVKALGFCRKCYDRQRWQNRQLTSC